MAKRPHTANYQEEADRFALWFETNKRALIKDRKTFNVEYTKETNITDFDAKEKAFRDLVFKHYAESVDIPTARERDDKGNVKVNKDIRAYNKKESSRDIPARVKGKVVFSSKETIKLKGHNVVIYRDRLGRFASVKK